jgi:putative SOS response-associated peptidase YedK
MCNRYGYQHPNNRLVAEFSDLGPVRWDGAEPNAPRDQIRPTDRAPILRRAADGGVELVELRWGLAPFFHKKPVRDWKILGTNARSETVASTAMYKGAYARRRCLVPATHYFEWTGAKGAKVMWRFTVPAQETFAFPGLWDRAGPPGEEFESFTLLTSAPGPDQSPYHNRQPVILERGHWAQWLDPANDMAPGFIGSLAGTLKVERFEGDWPL